MSSLINQKFPIRFDRWYGILSSALFIAPSNCYLEIDYEQVYVQMGWAFHCRFPRSAVSAVVQIDKKPLSRGVHGLAGRWLVNGSGHGIIAIDLSPRQRGYVLGFPVRLRQLLLSVWDPAALLSMLSYSENKIK